MGMKCIGGNFNIERHRGWRGDRLEELLCEVGSDICNSIPVLPYNDIWTLENCLGAKRFLDYYMVAFGINVTPPKAINDLLQSLTFLQQQKIW